MSIKQQIEKLPDIELDEIRTTLAAHYMMLDEKDAVKVADLKTLAASHTRLLEAARDVAEALDRLGGRCNPLLRAIEEAEKL